MSLRHKPLLRLRDVGYERLNNIVAAIPQFPLTKPILKGRTIALLMATPDWQYEEAWGMSIHAMGGNIFTPEYVTDPRKQVDLCRAEAEAVIVCGLPQQELETFAEHCEAAQLPVFNGGNALGQPCLALGDLALFADYVPLDTLRVSWIGGVNGLAHSLIEAAIYMPFELFMAVPEWGEPDIPTLGLALKAGARIFLTREIHLALDKAHYVYAGLPYPDGNALSTQGMRLMPDMLAHAHDDVRVLAGTDSMLGSMPDAFPQDKNLDAQRHVYLLRAQEYLISQWLTDYPLSGA